MTQSGSRWGPVRPIRDGGGKPSQGRLPPPQRRQPPCEDLCHELAALCEPWVEDFTASIHSGNKSHPFSIHLLRELREKLASYCKRLGNPWHWLRQTFPPGSHRGPSHTSPGYYPSAKEFTFEEEKAMGMVLGPMTRQEASVICRRAPGQNHLWWIVGWGKHPHSIQHAGKDHSSNSDGLCTMQPSPTPRPQPKAGIRGTDCVEATSPNTSLDLTQSRYH